MYSENTPNDLKWPKMEEMSTVHNVKNTFCCIEKYKNGNIGNIKWSSWDNLIEKLINYWEAKHINLTSTLHYVLLLL